MRVNVDVLLIKDGRILLQLRDDIPTINWPGYWNIPGGAVEKGETLEEAAKRELIEETEYKLHEPIPFKTYVHDDSWGKPLTRHVFYEIYDNKQHIRCHEGKKMKFVAAADFETLRIIPHDLETLREAVKTLML